MVRDCRIEFPVRPAVESWRQSAPTGNGDPEDLSRRMPPAASSARECERQRKDRMFELDHLEDDLDFMQH
jgi:hypothetical protein